MASVLGDGGMGTVHLGRDPRFDRPVAIKVLHAQFARDPEVSERFRAEAVIQAKLNHPNIVTVYDFLAEGDQLAMVMELVEGQTLAELIAGPLWLPEAVVVTVMSQVLSAVGFAHGKGLVHRDLKPSNVMVQDLGGGELVSKVMDFGIAKVLGAEKMRTATSAKMGTLAYMSPEQLRSPKSVDHRSDLYSLGAMLYEMLTGRVPYDADTEYELMRRAIEEEPPAPSRVVAELGSRWDAVVARAMAKDPAHRFQSGQEMRAAVRAQSGGGAASQASETWRVGMSAPSGAAAAAFGGRPGDAGRPASSAAAAAEDARRARELEEAERAKWREREEAAHRKEEAADAIRQALEAEDFVAARVAVEHAADQWGWQPPFDSLAARVARAEAKRDAEQLEREEQATGIQRALAAGEIVAARTAVDRAVDRWGWQPPFESLAAAVAQAEAAGYAERMRRAWERQVRQVLAQSGPDQAREVLEQACSELGSFPPGELLLREIETEERNEHERQVVAARQREAEEQTRLHREATRAVADLIAAGELDRAAEALAFAERLYGEFDGAFLLRARLANAREDTRVRQDEEDQAAVAELLLSARALAVAGRISEAVAALARASEIVPAHPGLAELSDFIQARIQAPGGEAEGESAGFETAAG